MILWNAILVVASSSTSFGEIPNFLLEQAWSMGYLPACFVISFMVENPSHILVLVCCIGWELLPLYVIVFFLGLLVSPFDYFLLEVAYTILTSLDITSRPWELWWELVVLEMSLDVLLEICDGAFWSLKMFLFVCPCILFKLCK